MRCIAKCVCKFGLQDVSGGMIREQETNRRKCAVRILTQRVERRMMLTTTSGSNGRSEGRLLGKG